MIGLQSRFFLCLASFRSLPDVIIPYCAACALASFEIRHRTKGWWIFSSLRVKCLFFRRLNEVEIFYENGRMHSPRRKKMPKNHIEIDVDVSSFDSLWTSINIIIGVLLPMWISHAFLSMNHADNDRKKEKKEVSQWIIMILNVVLSNHFIGAHEFSIDPCHVIQSGISCVTAYIDQPTKYQYTSENAFHFFVGHLVEYLTAFSPLDWLKY